MIEKTLNTPRRIKTLEKGDNMKKFNWLSAIAAFIVIFTIATIMYISV